MRTSPNGLAFISREEGLRTYPYNDSAGHATIGVGHLIHRGPVTAADRAHFRGFSRRDAIALLRRDIRSREAAVNRLVRRPLSQNQFDAVVSLVFNIGAGGFAGSTVLRRLNAGDRRGAAHAFLMWRIGGAGLIYRRRREIALFLKHPYDPLRALTKAEHHHAELLLHHRRAARHEARSGKGPKYRLHKRRASDQRRWISDHVKRLEADLHKSGNRDNRRGRIRVLTRVLGAVDGTL